MVNLDDITLATQAVAFVSLHISLAATMTANWVIYDACKNPSKYGFTDGYSALKCAWNLYAKVPIIDSFKSREYLLNKYPNLFSPHMK